MNFDEETRKAIVECECRIEEQLSRLRSANDMVSLSTVAKALADIAVDVGTISGIIATGTVAIDAVKVARAKFEELTRGGRS